MSNIPVDPLARIQFLNKQLEDEAFDTTTALITAFRSEKALLAELPAVFEGALESILERLESVAMFSGESCSFSQSDLLAALSIWLEKARSYLEKQLGIEN
ncbi:MAG TPA: hypothetical protein VGE55_07645 [Limnobacter sp.]|uniref:hypothetical protein n=1 Tax=Limnobacter sp. TaxID=2003368 RepID=UPI002ED86AAF